MPVSLPNAPKVKLAIVGVSRDCFPITLVQTRMRGLIRACRDIGLKVTPCKTIIEKESQVAAALGEAAEAGCNAAVVYLGNFGPEGPLSIFAQKFPGPLMICGAAEESRDSLVEGRGDAYCGMLNAGINLDLRGKRAFVPQVPVGLPGELARQIEYFQSVAKVLLGVAGLKIFSFGPRPQDFYACNAPIGQLYDLGVEVMENSELDLLQLFQAVDAKDPAVRSTARQMAAELGKGNNYPELLGDAARLEVALRRFAQANLGSRQFAAMANKCWPAFEKSFGFVPCYVNSRLAASGIPVACEVDIYGALSEYMCYLASQSPVTLLDINNTVPADLVGDADLKGAAQRDLFMGFHCGNTPGCCMKGCELKHHLIMHRLIEDPAAEPRITRGTIEGQLKPGPTTIFRVQGGARGGIASYLAQGNILDIDPRSFGSIGVLAIPNFARFYRHVLIGRCFPHHTAVAFNQCGRVLFDAAKMLDLEDIYTPLGPGMPYPGENPFEPG